MKTTIRIAISIGFLALGFPAASPGQEIFVKGGLRGGMERRWAPDEILVRFRRGSADDAIRRLNQARGVTVLRESRKGRFLRLRIPKGADVEKVVALYRRVPIVEWAEPNFIARAQWTPNDDFFPRQWHLENPTYGGIHMASAWDIEKGEESVIVAVIDTGVAYEDYGDRYLRAPDLASTKFVPGWDFVNEDSHPNDDNGHGTHVAGTIAQSTDNGIGVAGVAPGVTIMPVKVLGADGYGTYADVADGIYWAVDHGAQIIKMSLGGTSPSTILDDALAYAFERGVAVICAAGNEKMSGNPPLYPAAYDAYAIAVGATRFDETRSYYSNTGSYLDLAAPGGDLDVDQNGDGYPDGVLQQTFGSNPKDFGYYYWQGTSMATPHVSGVAALLASHGTVGARAIRRALEKTAEDKGPQGWDEEYGWGIVDAQAALAYVPTPEVHDVAVTGISSPPACIRGEDVLVVVEVVNQGDFDESILLSLKEHFDGTETEIGSRWLSAMGSWRSEGRR